MDDLAREVSERHSRIQVRSIWHSNPPVPNIIRSEPFPGSNTPSGEYRLALLIVEETKPISSGPLIEQARIIDTFSSVFKLPISRWTH